MIKDLAFVVYAVKDVPRATAFYRDVIGLKPAETFGDHWVEFDVGGQTFGVVSGGEELGITPGSQFSAAFEVDDLNAERERLLKAGVPITEVMDAPVCFSAFVTDPDGNRFALHERKRR